ncbi:hypothetical protein E3N88_07698 [Mikania micrantha]|uniref:Uncharacterized protein n=1 Tax=Mikania micrantha TaxID=192012 RepID=A0A5N6LSC0_9ASTR|nr:hypothetical protein E3N88_37874 [Mikania micrantha]KAD2804498.1 hypothetical protein E3N88_37875 [Mikania micrantha]KAD5318233.1 hypothetical protein E3N88_18179 [Mikania micrantha]KAD5960760.1 hypothetical protein E3N88_12232 [Mikania micrantha]KAD5960761.1 hypothetical protein E3N88_12233 [Mikania micrantha]
MTSSRYAMRKKFTFAIREGFRGFPACFVHRGDAPQPFQLSFSTIFEAGELSRSLRRHLGSIGGLEDLVYM